MSDQRLYTEEEVLDLVQKHFTDSTFREEFSEFDGDYKFYDQKMSSPGGCKPCQKKAIDTRQKAIARTIKNSEVNLKRLHDFLYSDSDQRANTSLALKEEQEYMKKVADNFKLYNLTKEGFTKLLLSPKVQEFLVSRYEEQITSINKKIKDLGLHHSATKFSVDKLYNTIWSSDEKVTEFKDYVYRNDLGNLKPNWSSTQCRIVQGNDILDLELKINQAIADKEVLSVSITEVSGSPTGIILYK